MNLIDRRFFCLSNFKGMDFSRRYSILWYYVCWKGLCPFIQSTLDILDVDEWVVYLFHRLDNEL